RPGFSRIFLDRLLTDENPEWTVPFFIGLAALTVVEIVVEWVQCVYTRRLDGKIAVVGNSTYLWRVLRLPMDFFGQRMAGDIQQRKDGNATVSAGIVNTFAPLVIDAFMTVFYMVIMFRYSIILTLIGLGAVLINIFVSRIISRKRMNITRIQMRDAGKLAGATSSGIQMIETIKASGAENGFFEKWSGYQASVNTQDVRYTKIDTALGIIPQMVTSLSDIAILMTGVWLTMNGEFTIGMIMAFQGYVTAFTSPATELIEAGQTLQEMRVEMERLEDVMGYPEDTIYEQEKLEESDDVTFGKLSGNVELKNVTFGYSSLDEPLIKDFNLSLKPGSRVAFVGSSGCGKSTISKLISGLYKPWSGEILFDGKPLSKIDRSVFTGSLAVVDQDIILFEDTIANNIKMWDNSIEDYEMIMAARDAMLHEDIMLRDGGYQYKITEGGKDFSGGQKQRMEIARVLAQDPTIIILDEATSALDAKTEYDVVRSIKDRGITCIVVAHRLSTIRDCDEIIVLDHGNVIERGTHEELMKLGGAYTQLVTSE
nr:ATP-binding cassette domain-containing protein [Lachnospiraceae bacterium]